MHRPISSLAHANLTTAYLIILDRWRAITDATDIPEDLFQSYELCKAYERVVQHLAGELDAVEGDRK